MDPITHGLLGAAVNRCVNHAKLQYPLWIVGLLAAMAPDLDVFIQSAQNPLLLIIYHRNFTHALVFIPFGGIIVGVFCMLFSATLLKEWQLTLLAAILGYATHGILDSMTSYGTMLYWPLSNARIALDYISIVDPIFTLALLSGVILSLKNKHALSARIALIFCFCYLCFGFWQHDRAADIQARLAEKRKHTLSRGRVTPGLGNLMDWNSIYITDNRIFLDKIITPLFGAAYFQTGTSIPLFSQKDLPANIQDNPILMADYQTFHWFADGYIAASSRQSLALGDMRYLASIKPPIARWGIEFTTPDEFNHVKWKNDLAIY